MFKRYEPKTKGDALIVKDSKIATAIFIFDLLFGAIVLLLSYFIIKDRDEGALYIAIFVILGWMLLRCIERKYIIRPDSIIIKHGLFRKRIPLERITTCFYSSRSYITLVDANDRETTIDLMHLPDEADDAIVATLKNCNVKIRRVGSFEKDREPGQHHYHFKMYQKGRVVGYITFAAFALLLDVPVGILLFEEDATIGTQLFLVAIMLGYTALWFFLGIKTTQTVYVDGESIEIKQVLKKTVRVNVRDISWVHNGLKHYSTKAGGYDVEELEIHVGDELLKTGGNISRAYKSYDLFLAYLQDYGIPFSLEEGKLLTYEKLEEDIDKDIPELLNVEEYAFTCNDDYVIENGLFKGRILDEELGAEGDFRAYAKKHVVIGWILKIVLALTTLSFIGSYILVKADVLDLLTGISVPVGMLLFLYLLSSIDDLMNFNDITRDASCFKATVFHADMLSKDQVVIYAYDAGSEIRLIEPMEINKKMSQGDYEALYNVPTYIWAKPSTVPDCVEGTDEKPLGKEKYVGKVILYLALEILLIVAVIVINTIIKPRLGLTQTENEGYESVMYDYDESFDEENPEGSSLVFPQDYTEIYTDTYEWGACATAIYAYLENGDIRFIGGHPRTGDSPEDEKPFLEKAWGITDRESAQEKIEKVITYGHQAKCRSAIQSDADVNDLISALEDDFGDNFTYEDSLTIDESYFKKHGISTNKFYGTKGAACAYMRFGENGLAGYDYLRLLRVINMCNDCGYLSDDEYMGFVYNLDLALQKQYSSFEEIHECYLYGEMFRLGKVDDNSKQTIEDILVALEDMRSSSLYSSVDPYFDYTLQQDWKDLLVSQE